MLNSCTFGSFRRIHPCFSITEKIKFRMERDYERIGWNDTLTKYINKQQRLIERSPISEGLHRTANIVEPRFVKLLLKNYYGHVRFKYLRFIIVNKYYSYSSEVETRKIYENAVENLFLIVKRELLLKIIFFYRQRRK